MANRLLKELFRAGYRYQKCGVQLSQIQPITSPGQLDLFSIAMIGRQTDSPALMQAVDRINRRFPKGIAVAATGFEQAWQNKAERISRHYTTDWRELVGVYSVKAKDECYRPFADESISTLSGSRRRDTCLSG